MARWLHGNPRLLLLLVGIISVAGISSYTRLPQMEDPVLRERFGIVRTVLPGANALRVESEITQPLEESIRTVKGIEEVFSESMSGISTISIELEEDVTDVDTVWSRVRDEISETSKDLPDNSLDPDFKQPELKAFASIIAVHAEDLEQGEEANLAILKRVADEMAQVVRGVRGTESVSLYGSPEEEILVELDPVVLDGLGLTVVDVARQIEEGEAKASAGTLRGEESGLVIELAEDFDTVERVGETPIRYGERGRMVELAEIAAIQKAVKKPPTNRALVDGAPAVVLGAFVRDEHRIDRWTGDLEAALDEFSETLPAGVVLDTLFEQNRYVTERIHQLAGNLLLATLAVVAVVFLLMGWRSMIVVGCALPLSTLMVITGMRFLGIPVHQMSVTGLIIALGLLIDNAIVMVDEVRASMREGASPGKAVGDTVGHLALPLLGSTLTTTFAFMPIAILPGSSGEFVGSIAVSVILAINSSFLLAMTVVPALTAILQPSDSKSGGFWTYGFSNDWLAGIYRWALTHLLRFPVLGILLGVSLPILGFYKARELPEQFFPPTDRDQFHIEMEMPPATTIAETEKLARQLRGVILEDDGVERVHWFLGTSAPTFFYNVIPRRQRAPFYAQALVELSEGGESGSIIRELQATLDRKFPEARILVRQLEQGPAFDAPVEVQLYGPDLARLESLGNEIRKVLTTTSEVVHTRSDLGETTPKLALKVDQWEAKMAGLTHEDLTNQLYTTLEGTEAGSLIEVTEKLPIRVRMKDAAVDETSAIESLELRPITPRGRAARGTPLSAIGTFSLEAEATAILRRDGQRLNEIKAYITAGTLPDLVITEFQERLEEADFELPPGYRMEFGGEAEKRDEAVGGLMANVGLLIALMITTLVASFRSFRVAMIVAIVGGMSIGLGLGAIWLFGYPFGFMGVVGTMGLVGVAVNDAIVVLAGIRETREARAGEISALADVIMRRTRHIVATSLTTMVGFIPLILSGGGFWPPVAVTIAGGVAGATILALFFVPCLYQVFFGCAGTEEGSYPGGSRRGGGGRKKLAKKKKGG